MLNPYLYYNGNTREALVLFTALFPQEKLYVMTFAEMPEDPNFPVYEESGT